MTDLEYIRQFDKTIDERFKNYKKRNNAYALYFLRNEKRYWEDKEISGEKGQYAPEPLD